MCDVCDWQGLWMLESQGWHSLVVLAEAASHPHHSRSPLDYSDSLGCCDCWHYFGCVRCSGYEHSLLLMERL